ncbi:fasciclin domain-containing protein [Chitinophaga sancti]|uniref:Fasciclin domain-containing protein n=1 Tax=Chitinophaga sancti TaxID=1004 RepID=A0A1K1QDD1_9BACT|nr:fasciclin domain-containing protein [Chitinophaga sancti]WQD61386.1 fasciclin domain-containing protein [Chitinophaga sancti]WQG93061.1 fasciclin domain-containing protein [Chitinophaga sancti]SFW57705.1 Uncaracterized surface protein containing fasciclin (FAS1) repeats [Chitinophaga sancti]
MKAGYIILLMLCCAACKKAPIISQTSDEVTIIGYLEKDPEQFSGFLKILKITGDEGFLGVYGSYTIFVPNNDAVASFVKSSGHNTLESIDVQQLKDLVKFCILQDTINTTAFSDGKLPQLTMYGQYLITGANNTDGVTRITVNRQAKILKANVRVSNGIIHVVDNVLTPATQTLAAMLASNPKYSIFTQALRETGLFDTLNIPASGNTDSASTWLTVLAESDSAINAAGFSTYAGLKARYSHTGDPTQLDDSLHLYVDYHILYGVKYLADIVMSTSHTTLAPLEVVTSKLSGQKVLINDDDFNGVHETGVELDRSTSDNSATNGVLHNALGHFAVKIRNPVPVYWDVADFPEIRNLPAYFRKQNYVYSLTNMPSGFSVPGPSAMTYAVASTYVNGDFLMIPLGGPGRSAYMEMKTPLLVKGKYKVWICYRVQKQSSSSNNLNQISIDGEVMQRTMNFTTAMPATTEGEMEAQGWKWYTDPTSNSWGARLVGTIEIKTTERHTLRFTTLTGTQNNNNLDMIHFIPQDMDQLYPRFKADGTPVPRP